MFKNGAAIEFFQNCDWSQLLSFLPLSRLDLNSQNKIVEQITVPRADQHALEVIVQGSTTGDDMIIWSLIDRTKEKEAEELAKNEHERAAHAEKMAGVGEMAASIVHEIRNPLTMISGQIVLAEDHLERETITTDFMQRLIARLNKSNVRINKIINSLLNLSRQTVGEEKSLFAASELAEELELFANMKVKGHKIPFSFHQSSDDIKINCIPSELSQVLVNLIKNAKEEIVEHEKPWVRIDVQETESTTEIRVSDSGTGIPTDVAKKIFDPYFTTKPRGEGTGLGLSLCRTLIEKNHGGRFYIDNKAENTCFVISLPK